MTGERVVWAAPGKLNLYLEVLGRRPDGFHEIRTVYQALDLSDRLAVEKVPRGDFALSCDTAAVPTDERNLVARAWRALKSRFRFSGGVRVTLAKRLPVGGGLGGGSSDAAAMLAAANALFGLGLPAKSLEGIASEIGSDVAFFLRGGTRLGEGRGEILRDWPPLKTGAFAVLVAGFPLSTADVYREGGFGLTADRDPLTILCLGIAREDPEEAARGFFNALERPAFSLCPELRRLKGKLLGPEVLGSLLCGSGSSLFAYYATVADARRAVAGLRAEGMDVRLALPIDSGVHPVG